MDLQEEAVDTLSFSSSKRQRISGPYNCEHLYVCLMPYFDSPPPHWFSVQAIPVASLVAVSPPPHKDSSSWEDDDPIYPKQVQQPWLMNQMFYFENPQYEISYGTGFVYLGDKLYSIGGQQRHPNSELSVPRCATWNLENMCFDFCSRVHPSSSKKLEPMNSRKPAPIVAEIGGLICVLVGTPFSLINPPNPFFEVYDPRDDSWSKLPPPPHITWIHDHDWMRDYDWMRYWMVYWMGAWECVEFGPLSCIVFLKKLCISTSYVSFAFNTETKVWEACELFLGFNEATKIPWLGERDQMMQDRLKGLNGGLPFAFVKKAILYEKDILICALADWGRQSPVVAYQTDGVKVQRMQLLFEIEEDTACDGLIDLGGGYICYQYHHMGFEFRHSSLTFVIFKVSRIGGGGAIRHGSDSDFLICEPLNALNHKIKGNLCPVYSFAL